MEAYLETMIERLNSGEIKDHLQNHFFRHHWSDEKWKNSMAGGGQKKSFQYCSDSSGTILFFRALQGLSGRNLIDPPSLQDECHCSGRFLQVHLSCRMCNQLTSHHQFRIDTWRTKFEQQTVFFLLVDLMDQHKDPDTIDSETPRVLHNTWKKHQNTVYWVDINLALKKGLKFDQTRSNAIILHETLPACCIPKVVRMETGEVIYKERIRVTSASSKDFLET